MMVSEMIKVLTEDLKENGDRFLVVMTDGNRYPFVELYSDDEHELYIEGYTE